ncbi:hypothetical protein HZR84_00875 [Hyphobacterium sp. CCMP332]|nr:hypothetical protein HZR84_00875 [Hyphobacterium sp. CCMP332]
MKLLYSLIIVFLFQSLTFAQQNGPFIKVVRDQAGNDMSGHSLVFDDNGDLIIGGSVGDDIFLLKMDPDGSIIWQDQFNLTGDVDDLKDLIFYNGSIYGCGYNKVDNNRAAFVFEYIPGNGVNWLFSPSQGNVEYYFRDIEIDLQSPTPGLMVYGYCQGSSLTDALILKLDLNGNLIPNTVYRYAATINGNVTSDDWTSAVYDNGNSYIAGATIRGVDECFRRITLSKFDHTTNSLTANKFYFENTSNSNRMYGRDIIKKNNGYAIIGIGTAGWGCAGNSSDRYVGYLTEIDASGTTGIQKRFVGDAAVGSDLRFFEVVASGTDNLIILASFNSISSGLDHILLSVKKNASGDNYIINWARRYDAGADETFNQNTNGQLVVDDINELAYFVGQSNAYSSQNSRNDLIIYKASIKDEDEGIINGLCSQEFIINSYFVDHLESWTLNSMTPFNWKFKNFTTPAQLNILHQDVCFCEGF